MRALERLERLMESALEEGFLRLLRPQLQPVELAKRLARAMEEGQTVGASRVYVPNRYVIRLSAADFASFQPYLATLRRELAEYLSQVAEERGFALPAAPQVDLRANPSLSPHAVEVEAHLVDASPAAEEERAALAGATTRLTLDVPPAPPRTERVWLIQKQGTEDLRFPLDQLPATVGRGLDNAVVLEDRRVSRHHAQLRMMAQGYTVVDLGSTNGTYVNGERVVQRRLQRGDVISLGGVELRFDLEETA